MTIETGPPYVECKYCHRKKKPLGRSAPLEMAGYYCTSECPGYWSEPQASDLWPGETRET